MLGRGEHERYKHRRTDKRGAKLLDRTMRDIPIVLPDKIAKELRCLYFPSASPHIYDFNIPNRINLTKKSEYFKGSHVNHFASKHRK
jgi:hypothetical protein